MNTQDILKQMTFEEKAFFLSGVGSMETFALERFGVKAKTFADGPHGTRLTKEDNCTHFPSLCNIGNSWSEETAEKMGRALAKECIKNNVDMLLGPGINIKRNILCGRNFEYVSEDPYLSGELGAGYINGLQESGVSASLKHFALNNQEQYRCRTSVETDERVMREIYLKGFEIAVKKSKPDSVMCAYNKVNAIWCSENEYLLKTILKDEWGYEGIVVSDWGAVHDISRSVKAGLDLQMPQNSNIVKELQSGIEKGLVTMEEIDGAVLRMLESTGKRKQKDVSYDRDEQHRIAKEIACDSIVMLKNHSGTLPINSEKYKTIAVLGDYATKPLIAGQGSAEVFQWEKYTDNPLEELKKQLPDTQFIYIDAYSKQGFSSEMLWPKWYEQWQKEIERADLVIFFCGAMESEDTEQFDRNSARINPNQSYMINQSIRMGKKTVVVLQSGGALILDEWEESADAIVYMGLAGESAGGAIADILSGKVNPSGKLSETFPKVLRKDLEYPGDGMKVEYKERFDVGYRYYDKNPDEILYPFGHGISYTEFSYSNLQLFEENENVRVEFTLKNKGNTDGSEAIQLYVGDRTSTVVKSIKELKAFKKVFLKSGEEKKISFILAKEDFSYYNVMLHSWVVENGVYDIYVGASSRDIRLKGSILYENDMPYSMQSTNEAMIG